MKRLKSKFKYGNKITYVDGIRFMSKRESIRYGQLKNLQASGVISGLTLQPAFPIVLNGKKICKVIMDFEYYQNGQRVVEDVKGKDNATSKLKRKLVEAIYDIKITITK